MPPLLCPITTEAARLAGAYARLRARPCGKCFGSGVITSIHGMSRFCDCGDFEDEILRGLPIVIDPLDYIGYNLPGDDDGEE